jgi:hypothetical protein
MILREHQIDEQGRMTVPTLIKLGDVLHIPARRTAAFVLANRPSQPRAF